MSKAKAPISTQSAKNVFDPKNFAKNGVSEEEVIAIKQAFDLFDTDQGGSIDIKGIFKIMKSSKLL